MDNEQQIPRRGTGDYEEQWSPNNSEGGASILRAPGLPQDGGAESTDLVSLAPVLAPQERLRATDTVKGDRRLGGIMVAQQEWGV